jgi:hypothetical protein
MLRQIVESVSNRDVLMELAKDFDTIDAVQTQGNELIVNGSKNGKKLNTSLSGKISDYKGFEKFFKKFKKEINKMLKELGN